MKLKANAINGKIHYFKVHTTIVSDFNFCIQVTELERKRHEDLMKEKQELVGKSN